jgi:hypothetical protein
MPIYHQLGTIPQKRHTVSRQVNGNLYQEELVGTQGFAGMSSLVYHLYPPTRVKQKDKAYSVAPKVAIENGFGFEDTYDGEYKYQKVHQDAQSKAEKNESGLWLSCPEWPEYPELTLAPGENECDPNYSGACVPITNSDLDCVNIGGPVNVIGTDIHRLDRDGDKKACLSS